MDTFRGSQVGVVVQCEHGHIVSTNEYDRVHAFGPDGEQIEHWRGGNELDHFANFLAAVASRRRSDLNADIVEGHLSSALCHTGNISHQLGKPHTASEVLQVIDSDERLRDSLERMFAHLRANEINVDKPVITVGASLVMDPAAETFTNSAANQLIRRSPRRPFVIPEIA
jgi:hypothetical protein